MSTDRRRHVFTAVPACTALLATFSLTGCGLLGSGPEIPDRATLSKASSVDEAGGMEALVEAARQEGRLNAVAMPASWANYSDIIAGFEKRYGIDVTVENPDGTSQDAIRAIQEDRAEGKAVDVVEVGVAQAQSAADEALFARYRIERDRDVPSGRRDPGSAWYANYGGYISIGCAVQYMRICPDTFEDLLKPEYKGKVALSGDPTKSNSALSGVFAAALSDGGSFDDITPGVEFFGKLTDQGNYIPVKPTTESIKNGKTPIVINWDFKNSTSWRALLHTNAQWAVAIPDDGVFAGYYATAINRRAAHPAAARLWQEYLFSDEAQNLRLKGFARPVLMKPMQKAGTLDVIAAGWLPRLPHDQPVVPSSAQMAKASKVVGDGWGRATHRTP
ncbi:extracellular solute-binding protein [Streptomyces sp. NPDC004285]